jgi:flagellar hook-associated protein 2
MVLFKGGKGIMSINRIGGLASGIDIDQWVSDLMKAHRQPLIKKQQNKQIWQWRQEEYRAINTSLLNLRNEAFNLKLQGTFLTKTTTSSNESVVTATAGASASATAYQIKVEQLATVATNSSAAPLCKGKVIIGSEALTEVNITEDNNQFKLTYGETTVNITLEVKNYGGTAENPLTDLVTDIQAKINDSLGAGKVEVSLTQGNKLKLTAVTEDGGQIPEIKVNSGTKDALEVLGFKDGQTAAPLDPTATLASQADKFAHSFNWDEDHVFSFKINGQTFEFDADTDSLNSVIAAVNANKAAGVSMFYDEVTDKIAITTTQTGNNREGAEIAVEGEFLTSALQIDTSKEQGGQDAILEINGLQTTRKTNTFTTNGVTFTLHGVTAEGFSGTATTVTVAHNIDSVFNAIKAFVDKYNEVIAAINDKLGEQRYSDYLPLTDEQIGEGALTDTQIDKWQEKARSGLLKNDSLLRGTVYAMRNVLSSIVTGLTGEVTVTKSSQSVTTVANSLSVIGITTGDYRENGKLHLDENQLREALQSNPDAVMELFTKSSEVTAEQGLAYRLYDTINHEISRITDKAGTAGSLVDDSIIGKTISRLDKDMDKLEDRLTQLEDRYWRQFTAMEKAISKMNQQSMWLAQQFMNG